MSAIYERKIWTIKQFLLLVLLLPVVSAVQAQTPVGTVLTSAGDVIAESAGVVRSLARRDSVFVGDTISAGPGGRVRFKLTDDSTYVIQENSTFTISEYNFNGTEDGTEVADFYLSEGVMEFVSGYIGKQDQTKFRINTEFAAIGLRGSGGIITTDSNSTQVYVTLGQLTAVSRDGQLIVLDNGQTTTLRQGGDSTTEQGNGTGAEQTMSVEGNDISAEDSDTDEGDAGNAEEQGEQEAQADEVAAEEAEEANDADGAEQGTDGQPVAETIGFTEAIESAAEIYAELLPDTIEPTQEDLNQALNEAVEAFPVLYAELVTVAIEAGLEPPNAALTATEALGGGGSVSEQVITEIFFVATEGLTDTADVEAALISAEGSPLVVQPTDTSAIGLDAGSLDSAANSNTTTPTPEIPAATPGVGASPAR